MNSFLRGLIPGLPSEQVVGNEVYLRYPELSDWESWACLRAESRDFLVPWEPTWSRDVLTQASFRHRLRRYSEEIRNDTGYAFFIFRKSDDSIVGGLNLSHVHRGVTQSCSLGYWVGKQFSRKGYTSDAVIAIIDHVFNEMFWDFFKMGSLFDFTACFTGSLACGFPSRIQSFADFSPR